MNDCEVALELLKLVITHCQDGCSAKLKKDSLIQLYREILAQVRDKEG